MEEIGKLRNIRERWGMKSLSNEANSVLMKVLSESTKMSSYSDNAVYRLHGLTDELPLFPQITSLRLDEFDRYFERVGDHFSPELLSFSGRIPTCTLTFNTKMCVFNISINGIDFNISLELRNKYNKYQLLIYNSEDFIEEVQVDLGTILEIEACYHLFVRTIIGSAQDDVRYRQEISYKLIVRRVAIATAQYEDLKVIQKSYNIANFVADTTRMSIIKNYKIDEIISGLNLSVNLIVGSTVLDISPDIVANETLSTYNIKKEKVFLIDCVRIQASAFKREASAIMEKANSLMEDALDNVVLDTVTKLNEVSQQLANTTAWKHTKVRSDKFSKIVLDKFEPAFVCKGHILEKGFSVVEDYLIRVESSLDFRDVSGVKLGVITNLPRPTDISSDCLDLRNENESTALIEDTAQRAIYIRYRVKHSYGSFSNAKYFNRDVKNFNDNVLRVSFTGRDGMVFRDGKIVVSVIASEQGVVSMIANDSKREVELISIIVCDKHAFDYIEEFKGEIALECHIFGIKRRFVVTNGMPLRYVSVEFGELYGLSFALDKYGDDVKFVFQMDGDQLLIHSGTTILHRPRDLVLSWGVFQYTLDSYNDVILAGDNGLLHKCVIRALRNLSDGMIEIDTSLNRRYFRDHIYSGKITDIIESCDDALYYKGLNNVSDYDKYNSLVNIMHFHCVMDVSYKRRVNIKPSVQRMYYNEHITASDKRIVAVIHDVNVLKKGLSNLEDAVEHIKVEIDRILTTLNPSFANALAAGLAEAVGSVLIGAVIGKVVKYFGSLVLRKIGDLSSLTKAILAVNSKVLNDFKNNKNVSIFLNVIAHKRLQIELVSDQMNKLNLVRSAFEKSQVINSMKRNDLGKYNNLCKMQEVDDVSKMLLLENYSRGVTGKNFGHTQFGKVAYSKYVHPELNVDTNDIYLPSVSVYYRPLDVGIRSVNRFVYKTLVNLQKVKHDLLYNAMDMSVRRPGHSYAVFTNYTFKENGSIVKTKIFTGIGELNVRGIVGSDINSGIGGVCVNYGTYNNLFDLDGRRVFKVLAYTESGYTAEDVVNLHNTLFKTKLFFNSSVNSSIIDKLWHKIAIHVDKKIVDGDLVHRSYIPDSTKMHVIRNIIDDPPAFDYHLLNNNCQTYTKELVRYMQTGELPSGWSSAAIDKANGIIAKQYIERINDVIMEMESDTTELISRAKRLVDKVEFSADYSDLNCKYLSHESVDTDEDYEYVHFVDNNFLYSSSFMVRY